LPTCRRIEVAKRSTDLQIDTDLPERAEVLVTEAFGSTVLNEHVIPTLAHALAELLQPGVTVVPNAASARAVGFNLAAFNDFSQAQMCLDVKYVPHDVLSDDFEVFRFDFAQPPARSDKRLIDVVATGPGRCFGIVQWLRLDLVEGLFYENRPSRSATIDRWYHMLHRFSEPIELNVGDHVRLLAPHNGHSLLISDLRVSD
jgi:type II protein arginine methyltransferase